MNENPSSECESGTIRQHGGNAAAFVRRFSRYIQLAIIAVVFATLLVVIGMVNVFSSDFAQSDIVSASSVIESHNEENGYESSFKKKSKRRRK